MYGAMLAKSLGAVTMAFGTHVTPMPLETLRDFPALDFVLRGEPELTLRELIDDLEGRQRAAAGGRRLFATHDAGYRPQRAGAPAPTAGPTCRAIKGLVWRQAARSAEPGSAVHRRLDALPMPLHDLLPLQTYRMPLMKGPFSFIVTSRGCPAGCKYCIKHVTYSPIDPAALAAERVMRRSPSCTRLGIRNIHMYRRPVHGQSRAGRRAVHGCCIDAGLKIRWTCNSRVDYVDEEMLGADGQGRLLDDRWGIESGNEAISKRAAQGRRSEEGARGADLVARRPASRTGATSSSACRARPTRRSSRRSPSRRRCRSRWRCSTSPRRTRARRSSSRW